MGALLRRWRREEPPEKVLETLQMQLENLESASHRDEQFYQKFIGRLMFYSIILYIVSALLMYFYYFPKYWKDRIVKSLPLLVFPIIIYGVRRFLMYVFSSRKRSNARKLEELRSKKQKVIETVKEKETYKKAKEILEKFDPDDSIVKGSANNAKQNVNVGNLSGTPGSDIRLRQNATRLVSTPTSTIHQPSPSFSATPKYPMMSPLRGMSPAIKTEFFINNMPPGTPPGPPRPIPLLPMKRTIADKFVDYLVGDGPSNRYALICKFCHSHNGMVLKDDFAYTTFRCCYCYNLNEASKTRPSAPRIEGFHSSTSAENQSGKITLHTTETQETAEVEMADENNPEMNLVDSFDGESESVPENDKKNA